MELEDQDTGERTSLLDKVMGSVSNPKIARHELMVRMRGFEDMANEMGLVGMFYTLTAPSRYHATHVHSGKRNDKYCNASPRKTQKYLCNVWSRVRAKWGKGRHPHIWFPCSRTTPRRNAALAPAVISPPGRGGACH